MDGNSASFAWVYDTNNDLIGYEASFMIAAGTYDFETHLNVNGGDTSSTGKKQDPLELHIECTPVPAPGALLLGAFGYGTIPFLRRKFA